MRDFKSFVRQQVASLALPADRERKVIEEWAAQLEEAWEDLRAGGLSDDEAWNEIQRQVPDWRALTGELHDAEPALVRLASPERGPLAGRATRGLRALRERLASGLARDLRSGIRMLVKERGFSASVILTLAICLGANAAIYTVVHAVLLRPMPVPEPDRIVGMGDVYPTITPNDILSNDAPSYFDRLAAITALEEQALFTFWFDAIVIDGVAEEVRGMRATPSFFRVLRVQPMLGRAFTDAEAEIGAEHKVILSYGLWQKLYAGDRTAVGRSLRLGWTGQQYTIVGVMPPEFSFFDQGYDGHARTPSQGVQFWIPLAFTPAQKSDEARTRYGFFHIGRLKPGATVGQVQAQLDALHATIVRRFPQFRLDELGMYTLVTPLQEALTRTVRRTLYLLWAGAGFVLLIGVINITNLALARAIVRRRELATRLALGAGRLQVVRQLIVEALLLTTLGGIGGVAIGAGILRTLAVTLENLPNARFIEMDTTVIVFIVVVCAVLGLLIGLIPAATTGRVTISRVLVDGSRSGTSGRSSRAFRRGVVVAQVGLSVVLLIAATLLLSSFRHLLGVDRGFSAGRVTTATIFPPPSRYADSQSFLALSNRLLARVRALPGVEAAGMTSNIALSGFASPATVSSERAPRPDTPAILPSVVAITPGYFEAMGTPLVRGRHFTESDRQNTLPVAIVDERLASRLWAKEDPIGKHVYRGEAGPFTVVGVVGAVRLESLAEAPDSIGTAYFPQAQEPPMRRLRWIAIKARSDAVSVVPAVRAALAGIDPNLPLSDIQTMDERTSRSLVSQRLAMMLSTMFAVVALFLSVLGIYGVLAHIVAQRTREFGIRLALGSSVRGVFRLVLKEGATLVGFGLASGFVGALELGRVLEGQLFGVRPTDPAVIAGVLVGTGVVALVACLAPARRATRVDPVDVLSAQ